MTESGKRQQAVIEVNKPLSIEGWKIYQLSYDETKGKWSDTSVFELVRDPWLYAVYFGLILMVIGAVCMFVRPIPTLPDREGASPTPALPDREGVEMQK